MMFQYFVISIQKGMMFNSNRIILNHCILRIIQNHYFLLISDILITTGVVC